MSSFTSTTRTVTATEEDRALKAKHAAMWASGSYPTVVDEVVHTLGGILVEAVDVQPGQRVLDVAAGTGTSAIPSARRGAEVIATDLTPELLDVGRAVAEAEGIELTWQTADAEALPFSDADFDVVLSSIGVMFAPHHQLAADELVRVVPSRRNDRRPQLDPERLHRAALRDHEAVRAAAPSGCFAGTALGQRRARPGPVRRPRRGVRRPPAGAAGRPIRRRGASSATS